MQAWEKRETLFRSNRTLVFRALKAETQEKCIIKSLIREHPTAGEQVQFFHEYEILAQLGPLDGILPAREKLIYDGLQSVAFPDTGGLALNQLLTKPLKISDFFKVALSVTETLGRIHSKEVIHKDINPSNIVSLPDFSKTWIIDFSIASKTQREIQVLRPVQFLEGTLHYLPPEQSGRINRSLDYRADYYSVGITFFELLTGRKPFTSEDTMELLHAHMVDPLPELTQLRGDVPRSLVEVIQKLVAKDPDDRYQSAWGIGSDLKRCQDLWLKGDANSLFSLRQDDLSERFLIPEKVYGREREIQSLLKVFEECQSRKGENIEGKGHLTLISGFSGVGKSALIHELIQPVAEKGGYLVEGKIDQFQRSILLSSFKGGLLAFFDLLTGESAQVLAQIKEELAQALKSNIGVITDAMPELSAYLGEFSKPSALAPDETRNRLLEAFTVLFQIITTKKSLVFFIDDLQWADLTTLELVEYLAKTHLPGFMLLGGFRSNEVAEGHPLQRMIKKLGSSVDTLELSPLMESAVHQLLEDTLGKSASLDLVTKMLIQKTSGSPFFVHQLLKKLYLDKMITRDPAHNAWQVDLEKLGNLQVSQNVVEFLLIQLGNLDITTQAVLSTGAACGTRFEFHQIARLLQKDPKTLIPAIRKAVDQEIVRPVLGNYQHLISSEQFNSEQKLEFQFLHDRLQQASYELKTKEERKRIHFEIGELLSSHFEGKHDPIAIAEHYMKADLPQLEEGHRLKIANQFFQAAIQAKTSSAFKSALEYVEKAQSFVEDSFWDSHPSIMRNLHIELAEISFRAGEIEKCGRHCQTLIKQSKNDLERAEAYSMMSDQAALERKFGESLHLGLKSMAMLGVKLHENTSTFTVMRYVFSTLRMIKELKNKKNGYLSILDLPVVQDPKLILIQKNTQTLGFPAYFSLRKNLLGVLLCSCIQHALRDGLTEYSAAGFACFPMILNALGNYSLSRSISEVGFRLLSHPASKNKAQVAFAYHMYANSFVHLRTSEVVAHLAQVFEIACEAREFVGLTAACVRVEMECSLVPLNKLGEYEFQFLRLKRLGFEPVIITFIAQIGFFEYLHAKNDDELVQTQKRIENVKQRGAELNDLPAIAIAAISLSLFKYLFDSPQQAEESFLEVSKMMSMFENTFFEIRFEVFSSLTILASRRSTRKRLTVVEWGRLLKIRNRFKKFTQYNPASFAHYYYFIEAEYAFYLKKSEASVSLLYRQALASAKQDGNLFMEALINEKAGEYYLAQGNTQIGAFYLHRAHAVYTVWEAWARVRYLETRYADLFTENFRESVQGTSSRRVSITQSETTTATTDSNLDFGEVLKAARSLSSEVVLSRLTEKLLKIVSDVSGAERGALFLPKRDGSLSLHSQFDKAADKNKVLRTMETPARLLDRVRIKKEPLIIADATKENRLKFDPYFQGKSIRSVVCLPTLNQGNLVGILYLENNEVGGAFTEAHMKTLDILASQAAVSIENAKLYEMLEEKVRERTAQLIAKSQDIQIMLENLKQGVFTITVDMKIHSEYSKYLKTIFGSSDITGKNPFDLIFENSTIGINDRNQSEGAIALSLEESLLTFEANKHLLPRKLIRRVSEHDQYLELEWNPILNGKEVVEKILVTIRDVTELYRLKDEAEKKQTELSMLGEILDCGGDQFLEFYDYSLHCIEEGRELAQKSAPLGSEELNLLFRNMHTIKGNARTLGLSYALDALHTYEKYYDDVRKGNLQIDVTKVLIDLDGARAILDSYHVLIEAKLSRNSGKLEYSLAKEFLKMTSELAGEISPELKIRAFDQLYRKAYLQSLSEMIQPELASLSELAKILGKEPPKVVLEEQGSSFRSEQASLVKNIFTQCLSNSLDHGLEPAEERVSQGKAKAGEIRIKCQMQANQIEVTLSDDGRGLNLGALQKQGVLQGRIESDASDSEIANLIFAPGISTSEKVTEVSGRGVGMDAVKVYIEEAGGNIQIEFTGKKNRSGFRPFLLRLLFKTSLRS